MLIRSRFAEEVAELKPVSLILTQCILNNVCSLLSFQMLSAVTQACREVKNSKNFGKLIEVSTLFSIQCIPLLCVYSTLQVVLLMGNYMNTGSRNAQSYGFDLSYLNKVKNRERVCVFLVSVTSCISCGVVVTIDTFLHIQLSSTKSADHKTTLLHFLANTVETRHPAILEFATDLRNVEEAAKCRTSTTFQKFEAVFTKCRS